MQVTSLLWNWINLGFEGIVRKEAVCKWIDKSFVVFSIRLELKVILRQLDEIMIIESFQVKNVTYYFIYDRIICGRLLKVCLVL